MKRNTLIFLVVVALFMLSSCVGRSRTELLNESSDEEVANQKLSSILDCIVNQDDESLKAIFSERALDESDNFEEDAKLLFEFFKGNMVSWEKSSGPTVYKSAETGKVIKEVDSYCFVKTDEQEYFFLINDYQRDDVNVENKGLNMLLVVLAENRLDIYKQENEILFKDGEKISPPGIYLPINNPIEGKIDNVTDYKVNAKEYQFYDERNRSFIVKYAQVSGLGNKSLESNINQTLKSSITEWINKDCEWMEESQMAVKCKNSKYLSLCYTIDLKDDREEDYMNTYTRMGITVDMRTGDRVFLDDLFMNSASLKEELEKYNYGNEISSPIDSNEAYKILHVASISEKQYLEQIYKTDPLVYDYIFTYFRAKPSFYLIDNRLVITRDENELDDVYIDFEQQK